LIAVNGEYYRGVMGDTTLIPTLDLAVNDKSGKPVPNVWVVFEILEGDGALAADSLRTNSAGRVHLTYDFSGILGRATVQALVRSLDTVQVVLRANTLIPGQHGQGQYVLVDDTYGMVTVLNGPPVSLDTVADFSEVMVANYEATLGVVFVVYDTNQDHAIEPTSPIFSVIVVDSVYPQPPDGTTKSARYEGKTADSIGIGSRFIPDIINAYGGTSNIHFDSEFPPSIVFTYDDLSLTFWCHQADTTVFQIDIAEPFDWSFYSGAPRYGDSIRAEALSRAIRRQYAASRR
jgi:hypothetical protein